jgi:hypothetical protein
MNIIKEPEGIDFTVESVELSMEDKKLISNALKEHKAKLHKQSQSRNQSVLLKSNSKRKK